MLVVSYDFSDVTDPSLLTIVSCGDTYDSFISGSLSSSRFHMPSNVNKNHERRAGGLCWRGLGLRALRWRVQRGHAERVQSKTTSGTHVFFLVDRRELPRNRLRTSRAGSRNLGSNLRSDRHGSYCLVAVAFRAGPDQHRSVSSLRRRLRANLERSAMIYATALLTALLFIYLGTALVRPEWF
jgi:hypothetical protein